MKCHVLYALLFTSFFSPLASALTLPIWKKEVTSLGYNLPKPIGFSISYTSLEQGVDVDSIKLQNWKIVDDLGLKMVPNGGMQKSDMMIFKADAWLLPFLNIYAIYGLIKGYSQANVIVTSTKIPNLSIKIPNFKIKLDGYMKGVGFSLAGGYGNLFCMINASFSKTTLTVIDGDIGDVVISPSVGYDFTSYGVAAQVWGGYMYHDIKQVLQGNLSDVVDGLPEFVPKDAKFKVEQHFATQWSPLIGMRYKVTDNWYLMGYMGLGADKNAFVSVDYRC